MRNIPAASILQTPRARDWLTSISLAHVRRKRSLWCASRLALVMWCCRSRSHLVTCSYLVLISMTSRRPQEPDALDSLKMEVGIEDCLHIEFEYDKSAYHLQDVVIGKVRCASSSRVVCSGEDARFFFIMLAFEGCAWFVALSVFSRATFATARSSLFLEQQRRWSENVVGRKQRTIC